MSYADDYRFGSVDFGFANDEGDNFYSIVEPLQTGSFEPINSPFRFPGVDGEFIRDMGLAGRTDVWPVFTAFRSLTYLHTFEKILEAQKKTRRTYAYKVRGRGFDRVKFIDFIKAGPAIGMVGAGLFVVAQHYQIVFRILDDTAV